MATGRTTAHLSATSREQQSEEQQTRQPATGGKQLSVLEILRIGAKQFVDRYREGGASWQVQGVLAKLTLCRTPALGGHEYRCKACNSTCIVANSCGDRHCPGCSGGKRFDFSERASKLLIDGVDYYQVVFTLPSELSRIALANRQPLANLLFTAAWKGLNRTIRREQQYEPAAIMVLHTWNQKLEAHWHVHALVPGSGPGVRNNQWKSSTAPPDSGLSDNHYLVDAINLRVAFRKAAISHLQRLRTRRKLKLDVEPTFGDLRTDEGWDKLIEHLSARDWVSFIQPPPASSSGPNDLVRYLTRYLTGGPISDSRIVTADEQQVTFLAREGKVQGGEAVQVPVTLSTIEFVRRWCLHIQPNQLTKTRYMGGWTNKRRAIYQAKCSTQLRAAAGLSGQPTPASPAESLTDEEESNTDTDTKLNCPACGEVALRLVASRSRPSWREALSQRSTHLPGWYRKSLEIDDEKFWDGKFGPGFNAWYLENIFERAYHPTATPTTRPAIQPMLPGLELHNYYALE
ncbi:IS91 family transposase [Planctomycetaceae bacterium SH139]